MVGKNNPKSNKTRTVNSKSGGKDGPSAREDPAFSGVLWGRAT